MKISQVHKDTQKDQQAIFRQITTRRIKIAALEAEIADLQEKLNQVAPENAAWWDGHEPTDFEVKTSDTVIPLPTYVAEHIRFGAYGMTSNFDGGVQK